MFGFDHDELSVFERTFDFVDQVKIDAVQASIVTPLPGTALHQKMAAAGRIIDTRWEHYDFRHAVFQPKIMTPAQSGNVASTLLLNIPVYYAYYADARRWIVQENRGKYPIADTIQPRSS